MNGEAAGLRQLPPHPIVTSDTVGVGAGQSAQRKASELKSLERERGGGRARGRSYRVYVSVCVSARRRVCGQAPWGGGAELTEPPCPPAPAQACFLHKLLMSL